jgi:hypothetical protein
VAKPLVPESPGGNELLTIRQKNLGVRDKTGVT